MGVVTEQAPRKKKKKLNINRSTSRKGLYRTAEIQGNQEGHTNTSTIHTALRDGWAIQGGIFHVIGEEINMIDEERRACNPRSRCASLDLHTGGDLDLALLPVVAGDTVSATRSASVATILAGGFLADDNVVDTELEARILGLHTLRLLLLTLLGETLALLIGSVLRPEASLVELGVLANLIRHLIYVTGTCDHVRVRNTHVRWLEDLMLLIALADELDTRGVLSNPADGLRGISNILGKLLVF